MNTAVKFAIAAIAGPLLCAGCKSSSPVDLGETTSKIAANVSIQIEKFAQTQQTLADARATDIAQLKSAAAQASNEKELQLAIMKLSRQTEQVTFFSNILAAAQTYADKQYAQGQAAAMREAILVKLASFETPANSLRDLSKDLDKLSQKESLKEQAAENIEFALDVASKVEGTLQTEKTNAMKSVNQITNKP